MARTGPAWHDARVLDLWERAVGLDRWRREDVLLAGDGSAARAVPRSLSERNAALLALRCDCFGPDWPLRSECPACRENCEFEIDARDLARRVGTGERPAPARISWNGHELDLRELTVDDLAAASQAPDPRSAALAILARCLSGPVDWAALSEAEIEALGALVEQADGGAALGFDLACPTCAHDWPAMFDPGEALWTELRAAAERALLEVDALARAYGWNEADIMRLSPARRAAYLQLVEAAP